LISGCYRPPSYSRDDDKLFDQCIETAYLTSKEVILTGDFNTNFLSQEFKKHYPPKSLMNMHFSQLVSDVTRPSSGTCLDHIYTNKCQHITTALVENYALSDHLPTFAVRKFSSSLNQLTPTIQ
jgi:endonuclease/exonuclease/phosphatase family metal-dependent hydrolase